MTYVLAVIAVGGLSQRTGAGYLVHSHQVGREAISCTFVNNTHAGMNQGFASPVFSFNSKKPSILEMLVFWLTSSMDMCALRIPAVSIGSTPPDCNPCTMRDVMDRDHAHKHFAQALADLS